MEPLIQFLVKSITVSGLLTAWYFIGLRGRRLHQYNRFFLLTTLFASITLPFLHFRLFSIPHTADSGLGPVSLLTGATTNAGSSVTAAQLQEHTSINWTVIAAIAVMTISLTLLSVLVARIYKVQRLSRQYPATTLEGVRVIQTDLASAPFTFIKSLFWNRSISLQGELGQLILRHELTHIEQGHTYDKLVCQILTCLMWFNPFYWMIQKELNIVHEFIADEQAVGNRDTETFAKMVLQTYNNGSYLVPQHHFFSSTIKRRLAMLQNTTQPSYRALRRAMVAPILALVVLLFSFTTRNAGEAHIEPAKKKIVVLIDAAHGGTDAGGHWGNYNEKDISLKCAQRIKELAPAYNIDVRMTRNYDHNVTLADRVSMSEKVKPDVFISLHVGTEPGKEKAKGDFDIYVSGQNATASKSSDYSRAIFQAMEENKIIPGIAGSCKHDPNKQCSNCKNAAQNGGGTTVIPTEKEGMYVLKNTHAPSMIIVLGNIRNKQGMQQLSANERMDAICNAILKGVVTGQTASTEHKTGCAPDNKEKTYTGFANSNLYSEAVPNQ